MHYDKSVTNDFLIQRQQMHVSTLSICSFLGRLSSGESPLATDPRFSRLSHRL